MDNPSESIASGVGQKSKKGSSDRNPNRKREQHQEEKDPPLKRKDFAIAFVEAVVGGSGFSLLGEYFDTVGFHGSKKWCLLLALLAVEFALAHLIFKAVNRKRIVWAIFSAIAVFEFVGLTIVSLKPASHQFSVAVTTAMISQPRSREGCPFVWCTYPYYRASTNGTSIARRAASPIYDLLYVRFTNEGDVPAFIDGYSIEARNAQGSVVRIPTIDVRDASFYMINGHREGDPDFVNAGRVEFVDGFLQIELAKGIIAPHQQIYGWLLLDIPKDGTFVNCEDSRMQFCIRQGREKPITKIPVMCNAKPTPIDIDFKPDGTRWLSKGREDISGCDFRFFSDGAILPVRFHKRRYLKLRQDLKLRHCPRIARQPKSEPKIYNPRWRC